LFFKYEFILIPLSSTPSPIYIFLYSPQLCTRLFSTARRRRTNRESGGGGTSTLNDIIFDPEEEQRANLEESLLSSGEE
jgi:hypothetical protein